MTELQTSLFEAMKAFSDNAQQNSNATRTVEASIVAIVNEGLGEYTVNYLGQKFSAFSNNPNLVYSVDDKVFILIPDGDFTKKKIILGLASEQLSYTTTEETDDGVTYYELSDNLFDLSRINMQYSNWHLENGTLSLSSYSDISKYQEDIYIDSDEDQFSVFNNGQLFAKNLNNYLKYSRILKLSFLVKTNLLLERQNSGQYGIAFSGQLKNSYNEIYYTIDTNNMLGNPYKYNEWTPQTLYISIDKDAEFEEDDLSFYLYFWANGFPLTTEIPSGDDKFDIFIKDISLKSVTAVEQDDNGYILTLKATEGLYFNQNFKTVKTITPTLKVNGKTVNFMHDDSTEIYWFRQNSSIGVNDNKYCYYAGPCWECLNETTNLTNNADGTVTYNWIKNISTLEVNKRDVFDSMIYKCIIIYQGKQISADITLINSDSSAFVELNTETGSTKYVNGSGVVNFIVDVFMDGVTSQSNDRNNFSYYWGRFDKRDNLITDYVYWDDEESDNGIIPVATNEMITKELRGTQLACYESTFKIPVYLIDQSNTFYCTVKYIDKNNQVSIIGTKSITITTTNLEGYQLIVSNENTLYKYDTDGDSPMGEAYDGPTTSKVTSIAPLSFRLNKPDGTELTDSEYAFLKYIWKIPKHSMFKINTNNLEEGEFTEDDNYYYITGHDGHKTGLSYSIEDRFDKTRAEKKVILIVEFNNEKIEKEINIIFIKEGESGTNGTAYAAVLVSGSSDPDECVPYGNGKRLIYFYACNSGIVDSPLGFFDNENRDWRRIYWGGATPYRIYPKVYKDSQLLKYNDDYDIEYSMFDSSESGMAKPILQIGDENRDSVTGGILLTEFNSSVAPASPNEVSNCTILQAKITVKAGNVQNKGANSNDTDDYYEAPQIIYAYYPIDVYYFWNESAINYIPIIGGGFSQVMYEPDGTNPSYDDTKFIFDLYYQNDSMINSGYYKLIHKNGPHLRGKTTPDQNENGSDISVRLEPDMKYDDGNGGSYIALSIAQDNIKWNLETLQQKANELEEEYNALQEEYDKYYNSREQLGSFGDYFYFNSYINDLKNLQTFLELKNSGVESLTQIINYVNDLLQYISIQKTYNFPNIDSVCASTLTALNNLLTEATTAIKQIDHLDGSEGYTKNDLISLIDYIIELDEATIDLYKEQLSFNCAITIKTKIDDINNSIENSYQVIYNNLMNLSSIDSNIDTYNNIISSIEYACSKIDDTNLSEYIDLRDKILVYLEEFKKTSAINDLINILNQMYVNVLKNVFYLSQWNNYLSFLDSTYRFFGNKLNNINEQIYRISNSLSYINYCIDYWDEGSTNILAIYVRSISMHYNRYGMSNINGWDGNKIDTGDGSYLLAPQVGAGIKNNDNSFTGMLMGIRKPGAKQNAGYDSHVGLFGYYYGKQTLFLNAQNGSALFGPPDGGQIVIDPTAKDNNIQTGESKTRGMIYSANYWKEYQSNGLPKNYNQGNENGQGLLIDFTNAEIKYGTRFFTVDNEGNMHAGGGGEGDVGGWDIYNTYLTSHNFRDGISGIKLDAQNAQFIFGSEIGSMYSGRHSTINSSQTGFYISNQGISINNIFRVTENAALELGNLSSNHWKIFGSPNGLTSYIKFGNGDFAANFSSENVQDWKIITRQSEMGDTGNIAARDNEVYLGTDGIRLGTRFAVDSNGKMIAFGAKFSGDISGSTINGSAIIGSSIVGGSLRIGDNFSVNSNGILTATGAIVNNLTANGIQAENAQLTGQLTLGRGKMLSFIDERGDTHTFLGYYYDSSNPYSQKALIFDTGSANSIDIRFDDDVYARRYVCGDANAAGRQEAYWYYSGDTNIVQEAPQYKTRSGGVETDHGTNVLRRFFYNNVYFYQYQDVLNPGQWPSELPQANCYAAVFLESSDIRYKKVHPEWINMQLSKDIICGLEPIAFDYTNGNEGHHRGFSAQQVQEVLDSLGLPEMVYKYNVSDDKYFIAKDELIPDLVNCIKDLYAQINELKEKLNEYTN